jgi:hypothetical protein
MIHNLIKIKKLLKKKIKILKKSQAQYRFNLIVVF